MTRVFLLGNATPPGYRCPTVAPGLRVFGLQEGLAANGVEATIVVPEAMLERRLERWRLGPETPRQLPGTVVLNDAEIPGFLIENAPATVIMTNGVSADRLEKHPLLRIGLDFFSATVLEHRYRHEADEQVHRVIARKLEAIAMSDFFLVNGNRRVPYCHGWLAAAGLDVRKLALASVNMCPPADFAPLRAESSPVLTLCIAGYDQAWAPLSPVLELLESLAVRLPLKIKVVAADDYWNAPDTETDLSRKLKRLEKHPAFDVAPPMDYASLGCLLKSSDLFLDLFDENIERYYSMSTRAIVAIAHGVPIVHPAFTEVGELVARHDAGWTTPGGLKDSLAELESALREALENPGVLARKQEGARELARTAFSPVREVRKLMSLL